MIDRFIAALVLALFLVSYPGYTPLFAQPPDLAQARLLAESTAEGHALRVWQIPKRAATLVPMRFFIVEDDALSVAAPDQTSADSACPACQSGAAAPILGAFDAATIRPVAGREALLAYPATSRALRFWGDSAGEIREIFRVAGQYELKFTSTDNPNLAVRIPLHVEPYQSLSFGREFGLFAAGCLVLGLCLILLVRWLGTRKPGPSPA